MSARSRPGTCPRIFWPEGEECSRRRRLRAVVVRVVGQVERIRQSAASRAMGIAGEGRVERQRRSRLRGRVVI